MGKLKEEMIEDEKNKFQDSAQAKINAIAVLLANVNKTNLWSVCENLGWKMGSDGKSPKQKHYKVAIIHILIKTAKDHNWHIIHNAGFFYIYDGAY
jgi:hypothetical protein